MKTDPSWLMWEPQLQGPRELQCKNSRQLRNIAVGKAARDKSGDTEKRNRKEPGRDGVSVRWKYGSTGVQIAHLSGAVGLTAVCWGYNDFFWDADSFSGTLCADCMLHLVWSLSFCLITSATATTSVAEAWGEEGNFTANFRGKAFPRWNRISCFQKFGICSGKEMFSCL